MCNIRRLIIFLGIVITLFKISCKPQKSLQANDENRKYFEDLSYIRSSQITSNTENESKENLNIEKDDIGIELDSIISIIKLESKEIKFIDGFTIQIYLGDSRLEAEEAKEKLQSIDSLISSKIIFTQPNYRVKVGNYLDRFKVNKDIRVFKKDFPNAIVTPEKIEIN